MIRSITPVAQEPAAKAGFLSLRPTEGFGERASNDAVEQQSVAVTQAAVIALGTGVKTSGQSGTLAAATYSRPPPSSTSTTRASSPPPAPVSSGGAPTSTVAASQRDANTNAAAKAEAAATTTTNSADATSSGQDDDASEVAADSFLALSAQPIKGDTEATLQKLLQMRDDALAPPASVADLAIATAAALRISRLVRERYAAEQVSGAKPQEAPVSSSRPTLPPAGVKA
jgi:hypothetical protein